MKNKGKFILSGVSAGLTILLIILIRFVDVRPIGPNETSVKVNKFNRYRL